METSFLVALEIDSQTVMILYETWACNFLFMVYVVNTRCLIHLTHCCLCDLDLEVYMPSILDKNKTYTRIVMKDEKKRSRCLLFVVELLPDADVMFTPSI